jgi:hypothetical protein
MGPPRRPAPYRWGGPPKVIRPEQLQREGPTHARYEAYAAPPKRERAKLLRLALSFAPKGTPDYVKARHMLDELEREGY